MYLAVSLGYIALMLAFRESRPVQVVSTLVLLALVIIWMGGSLRKSLAHYRASRLRPIADLHDTARYALGVLSGVTAVSLLLESRPPRLGLPLAVLLGVWALCYLAVLGLAVARSRRARGRRPAKP